MSTKKLHDGEVDTDAALVRRLLETQFPERAGVDITPVSSSGTDNALYRLGRDEVARLPRIERVTAQVHKEHAWLPRLAPRLPLEVPTPLALGESGEGFPWPWSIVRWIEGENAEPGRIADECEAAAQLAAFVRALQQIDATDGPPPGEHNFFRGVPLAARDAATRTGIAQLEGVLDTGPLLAAWEAALAQPEWNRAPVWIHGDLQPGNLLVADGRLRGVIDFGGLGVGDPACDTIAAWNVFGDEARAVYREQLGVDEATWARGRGWAVSIAAIGLPYYLHTHPGFVRLARSMLDRALADA